MRYLTLYINAHETAEAKAKVADKDREKVVGDLFRAKQALVDAKKKICGLLAEIRERCRGAQWSQVFPRV